MSDSQVGQIGASIVKAFHALKYLPSHALGFAGPLRPRSEGLGSDVKESFLQLLVLPGKFILGAVDLYVGIQSLVIAFPLMAMSGEWVWGRTNAFSVGLPQTIANAVLPLLMGAMVLGFFLRLLLARGASAKVKAATKKILISLGLCMVVTSMFSSAGLTGTSGPVFPSGGWQNKQTSTISNLVASRIATAALSNPLTEDYGNQQLMSCSSLKQKLYLQFSTQFTEGADTSDSKLSANQATTLLTAMSVTDEMTSGEPLSTAIYGKEFGPKISCLTAIWDGNLDEELLDWIAATWKIGTFADGSSFLTISDDSQRTMAQVAFLACDAQSFADGAVNGRASAYFAGMYVDAEHKLDDGYCKKFYETLTLEKDHKPFDITTSSVNKAARTLPLTDGPTGKTIRAGAAKALKGTVNVDVFEYNRVVVTASISRLFCQWPLMWIGIGMMLVMFMSIYIFGLMPLMLAAAAWDWDKYGKQVKQSFLVVLKRPIMAILFLICYLSLFKFTLDMFTPFVFAAGAGFVGAYLLLVVVSSVGSYRFLKHIFKKIGGDPTSIRGTFAEMNKGVPEFVGAAFKEFAQGGAIGKFAVRQVKQAASQVKSEFVRTTVTDRVKTFVSKVKKGGKVDPNSAEDIDENGTVSPSERRAVDMSGRGKKEDGSLKVATGEEADALALARLNAKARDPKTSLTPEEEATRAKLTSDLATRGVDTSDVSVGMLSIRAKAFKDTYTENVKEAGSAGVMKFGVADSAQTVADHSKSLIASLPKTVDGQRGADAFTVTSDASRMEAYMKSTGLSRVDARAIAMKGEGLSNASEWASMMDGERAKILSTTPDASADYVESRMSEISAAKEYQYVKLDDMKRNPHLVGAVDSDTLAVKLAEAKATASGVRLQTLTNANRDAVMSAYLPAAQADVASAPLQALIAGRDPAASNVNFAEANQARIAQQFADHKNMSPADLRASTDSRTGARDWDLLRRAEEAALRKDKPRASDEWVNQRLQEREMAAHFQAHIAAIQNDIPVEAAAPNLDLLYRVQAEREAAAQGFVPESLFGAARSAVIAPLEENARLAFEEGARKSWVAGVFDKGRGGGTDKVSEAVWKTDREDNASTRSRAEQLGLDAAEGIRNPKNRGGLL
jgi:hypothetical protein